MDDLNKVLFAFAAYNAGPARVRQLRREASERGLDPNVWFNNVERVASERIGRETVTYVSDIYKYYVTYLLIQGEYIERRELKKKGELSSNRPNGGNGLPVIFTPAADCQFVPIIACRRRVDSACRWRACPHPPRRFG